MLPPAIAGGLLVVATFFDGAFHERHWAPTAVLALVMLAVLILRGGAARPTGAVAVALTAIWAFAAWTALSMWWAISPGLAFEGTCRTLLYAALATVPLVAPAPVRALRAVGYGAVAGVGVIALVTLVRIFSEGGELFLAGRLDSPVGYRNATAALFAFPFWPFVCFAAVRGHNRALRATSLSLAALCFGLSFMTQSRGVLVGLLAGGVVAVALGPERVRRIWTATLAFGAIAVAANWLLTPYDAFDAGRGAVTEHDIDVAARALALAVAGSWLVGLVLAALDNGLRPASPQMRHTRTAARLGLAVGVVVAAVVGLAAVGNPIDYGREKLDEFSDVDTAATGPTRIGSVSGQRSDLWRVAWNEFTDSPLEGVGESNYPFDYYRERRTDRNLTDPHSLPMRILAETGLVGTLLFAAFLVSMLLALIRGARAAGPPATRVAVALAAGGVCVIAQNFVDWIWLVPGLTGLGLFSLSLAVASVRRPLPPADTRGARRLAWAGGLLAAALAVAALFLSDLHVRAARADRDRGDPQAQLDAARRAGTLDPFSLTPLYLEASALEALGRRREARERLEDALRREPRNFATLGLLGDFEVRSRDRRGALDFYARALAENPGDVGLRRLAGGQFAPP